MEGSGYQWVSDGEVQIRLKKAEGGKYWKSLLENEEEFTSNDDLSLAGNDPMYLKVPVQTWWEMKDKFIDQVEEMVQNEQEQE